MGKYDEISRDIAAEYINSIIFIDDNIFFPNAKEDEKKVEDTPLIDEFPLNADSISKSFAQYGIPCSFVKYDKRGEDVNIIKLLQRADVGIVDWRIIIDNCQPPEALLESAEEVVEDTGAGRGEEAKRLITQFIALDTDCPKLVIVYTADSSEDIINLLDLKNGSTLDNNAWVSNNGMLRIVVWYKEEREDSRLPEGKSKYIVKHEVFPKKVIEEFALLHNGILPCITLKIINEIRQNSKMLLGRYNGSLDPAFIIHRAMSLAPDASNSIILESIMTSIASFIDYSNIDGSVIDREFLGDWITKQGYNDVEITPDKDKKNTKICINDENRIKWLVEGFNAALGEKIDVNYHLKNNAIKAFTPPVASGVKFNEEFSINTLHKSHFTNRDDAHKLSLGSIVKRSHEGNDEYFMCIQQKCDSVRILNSKPRHFLFLSLSEVSQEKIDDSQYDLIIKNNTDPVEYKYFKILQSNSYNLCVYNFKPQADQSEIVTKKDDNLKPYFEDENACRFYWVFDLKDVIAQAILNNYAAKISRVGLNEYEWLRVQPNKH